MKRFFYIVLMLVVAAVTSAQSVTLVHQRGKSNRPLQANGMQSTSEVTQVMYMKNGETKPLQMPIASYGSDPDYGDWHYDYHRYFNYDTDRKVESGLSYPIAFSSSTPFPETTHNGDAVYVKNTVGWNEMRLYMYGDVNSLDRNGGTNAGWPGLKINGTVEFGGDQWFYFDLGAPNNGKQEHLIFNNNNGDQIVSGQEPYITLTAGGTVRYYDLVSTTEVRSISKPDPIVGEPGYDFGHVYYGHQPLSQPRYTFSGSPIKIGYDASNYTDYTDNISSTGVFTEPTISYRVIYDIRPASEIAEKINTTDYLETYEITAPTNNRIYLQLGNTIDNYYFGPDQTQLTTSNIRLSINGASEIAPTILGGRVLDVGVLSAGTHTFEVRTSETTGRYLIAKFVVTVVNKAQTGPVQENVQTANGEVLTDAAMHERYDLAADPINFDHPNPTHNRFYNTPGAFDQIDYGFRYPDDRYMAPNIHTWGEYALMNNNENHAAVDYLYDLRNYQNQSDATQVDGYYLAVDATDMPGVVADFVFTGNLCPGSEIYFSARVANMNSESPAKASPNLNFVVYGKNGAEEKYMKTFTTGNFGEGADAGEWLHVFFTLHLDENKYQEYRLKIINNGASSSGNDFAIDDIRIYKAEPRSRAFQAIMACGTDEDNVVAVLRNDYLGSGYQYEPIWGSATTAKFFYQWQEADGSVIDLDYLDGDNSTNETVAVNNGHNYGQIELDNTILTREALIAKYGANHYYDNLRQYLSQAANLEKDVDFFFTHEQVLEPDHSYIERPVLYITNKSAMFQMYQTYNSITSIAQPDFEGSCSSTCTFTVQPRTQLVVDGIAQNGYKVSSICAGQTYALSVQVWDDDASGTEIRVGGCRSDWYEFDGDTAGLHLVTKALWNLRKSYPTGTYNQSTTADYTREDKNLLRQHAAKIQWDMGEINMQPNITGATTYFMIVPIAGSGTLNGRPDPEIDVCNAPVVVELKPQSAIEFGLTDDIKPDDMPDKTAVVRITEHQAKYGFDLPVFDSWNNAEITSMKIVASTADITSADNYMLNVAVGHNTPIRGDFITITPASISPKYMKPGERYEVFVQLVKKAGSGCEVPAAYYSIIVVPDVVVWSPIADNRAWNNDANWKMTNGHRAYVPLPTTNVIIPSRSTSPSLPTDDGRHITEPGAQPYITYDIYYAKRHCHNIYFEPEAMLQNQHVLQYDSAWVDMGLKKGQWNLITPPLKQVYSGDFFIPSLQAEVAPFRKNTVCDGRVDNLFYQSLYNQATYDMTYAGYTVAKESDGWTEPGNALDTEYTPCTAVAVRYAGTANNANVTNVGSGAKDTVVLKLPKQDTRYYYYRQLDSTIMSSAYVDVYHSADAHRFAFQPTEADGKTMQVQLNVRNNAHIFFVGNPMMASLDLAKFYAANQDRLENTFWVGEGNTEEVPPLQIENIYNGQASAVLFSGNVIDYVKPLHGFFVMLKQNQVANTVTLDFAADMANITSFDKINAAAPARRAAAATDYAEEESTERIYLTDMEDVIMVEATQRFEGVYRDVVTNCAIVGNGRMSDKVAIALDKSAYIYMPDSSRAYTVKAVDNMVDINVPLAFSYPDSYSKIADNVVITNTFNRSDLYLYDSKLNRYTKLEYGENAFFLRPQAADVVRYYIRSYNDAPGITTGVDDVTSATNIWGSNEAVHIESDGMIGRVEVFNALGQLVYTNTINNNTCSFDMMPGVYVVRAGNAVQEVIVK